MCGLLAVLGLPAGSDITEQRIELARDVMSSRGPDAASFSKFEDSSGKTGYLAHRRLSIQDLSSAAEQPMHSASGRCSIVYNGEVYNTDELRSGLEARGILFRTTSDTEVILEGYEVWGPEVVDKLNGMFAFVIWDRKNQTAFLARDRVGIKPLYMARHAGGLACASDMRALTALGYGGEINQDALALYLMLGYVPAPRSIWNGIEKIEAGETLLWSVDGSEKRNIYWSAPTDTDFEGSGPRIDDLIDMVVEEHLLSDVPLGLFLSGGIDSSVIAASIAGLGSSASHNITALTVAYPGDATSNEAPIAIKTAEILGLEVQELALVAASDHSYGRAVSTLDEPLAYNAVVSQSAISELAAKSGLKVVLSGDGGDEVFGGYRWHLPAKLEDYAYHKRGGVSGMIKSLTPNERQRRQDITLGQRFRNLSDLAFHAYRVFPALRPDHVADIVVGMSKSHCEQLLLDALDRHDAPALPWKRRMQRVDLYTFCQDVVLPKVDRAGMAYSVEARPPLLDHRIVEWGLSRPISDEFDAKPKNALRGIVRSRGLGFLLDQPKRGFSLKLGVSPDAQGVKAAIDRESKMLGISQSWDQTIHRRVEHYQIKMDTLLFLSLWSDQTTQDSGAPGSNT